MGTAAQGRRSSMDVRLKAAAPRAADGARAGMATLGQLKADTLVEQAYQALREAITKGKFPPGAALSIRSLAQAMGTSAMPIRDSLQRLAAEGALVLAP